MNTSKYNVPRDSEYYIGHFTIKNGKRPKKTHREWLLFPQEKQFFVNASLLSEAGLMCLFTDGIDMIQYSEKSPTFINSQWIIDEKICGEEFSNEIKRLQQEVLNTLDEDRLVFSENMKQYK